VFTHCERFEETLEELRPFNERIQRIDELTDLIVYRLRARRGAACRAVVKFRSLDVANSSAISGAVVAQSPGDRE